MTFPPGTLAVAVERSNNAKLGDAATTYAAQASCPTDCVFFDGGGCYAENGPVGKFVTEPLNRAAGGATAVEVAKAEAAAVDALAGLGRPLRLHTVGDCPTDECARIVARAAERYMERGGGPVWTYTHAWRVVARISWGKVSVLASCETPEDVALAHGRGYATAIVVEEFPIDKAYRTATGWVPGGVTVVPCPAQTRNVPCSDCGLCFRDRARLEAGVTIGFALHGNPTTRRFATRALRTPDDPDRKLTSRVLIPRLLADEPDLTDAEIARRLDMSPSSVYEMRRSLAGHVRPPRHERRR